MTDSRGSGNSGTAAWSGPMCFVENENGSMKLNTDTLNRLKQIKEPLVVVSIIGPYRTGKSYLMNRLAGSQTGFDLGSSVQAKTKGIWIWCVLHPTKPNYRLLLMDTEGIGDAEKVDAENNDVRLFLVAALLSSTLVYNSKGTIDNDAITKIHFVSELAEKIKITKNQKSLAEDGDDRILCNYLPTFVWAVRDFTLELEIDGRPCSADDYLNRALKLKPEDSGSEKQKLMAQTFNLPRACIQNYFTSRKCFVFPLPVLESALMSQLETIRTDQLDPAFLKRSEEFYQHVMSSSHAKRLQGIVMNGPVLSGLAEQYINAISSGAVPCIESAFIATANAVNRSAIQESIMLYLNAMSTLELPTVDEQTLTQHDKKCAKQAQDHFANKMMASPDAEKIGKELSDILEGKYQEFSVRNDAASAERCKAAMERAMRPITAKMDGDQYARAGGYTDYLKDIAAAYRAYEDVARKGVKALAVQQEYAERNMQIAKTIAKADDKLTEANRIQEEQAMKTEAMRLEQDALKGLHAESERRMAEQALRQQELQQVIMEKMAAQAREQYEQMQHLMTTMAEDKARDAKQNREMMAIVLQQQKEEKEKNEREQKQMEKSMKEQADLLQQQIREQQLNHQRENQARDAAIQQQMQQQQRYYEKMEAQAREQNEKAQRHIETMAEDKAREAKQSKEMMEMYMKQQKEERERSERQLQRMQDSAKEQEDLLKQHIREQQQNIQRENELRDAQRRRNVLLPPLLSPGTISTSPNIGGCSTLKSLHKDCTQS